MKLSRSVITQWFPYVVIAVACLIITGLVRLNRRYERQLRHAFVLFSEPYRGAYVPAFNGMASTGRSVVVGETESAGQVLLVFTTACPYCRAMLPAWKDLAAQTSAQFGGAIDVVGISLDSMPVTRRYVEENLLEFPVVSLTDPKLRKMYRSGAGVPQTLVLDSRGKIMFARVGMLTAAGLDSTRSAVTDAVKPRTD